MKLSKETEPLLALIKKIYIVWSYDISNLNLSDTEDRKWAITQVLVNGTINDIYQLNYHEIEKYLPTLNLPKHIKELWQNYFLCKKKKHIKTKMIKRFYENKGKNGIISVRDLKLPIRARHALALAKVETIEQLVQLDESILLQYRNLGIKSIKSIKDALTKIGLQMKGETIIKN